MADQLSALGFESEQMEAFFAARWKDKQVLDMENGLYVRLDASESIACYLSVSRDTQQLLDWDAHCLIGTRLPCAFDADLLLDQAGQSGLIRVLLSPAERDIPLVVSAPVLGAWDDREPGAPGLIQPAFCAERIMPADAEADPLLASSDTDNVSDIRGEVRDIESCVNPFTGRSFWHITLLCLGNLLDVFCEEALLPATLARGGMAQARCVVTALVEPGVTQ